MFGRRSSFKLCGKWKNTSKQKIFDKIWIQPASGDAGGSLGAALAFWHIEAKNNREINSNDNMNGSYLGTEFSQEEIEKELENLGAVYETCNYVLIDKTAKLLSDENAIGWFQGRMEFGPRALGGRSILGRPKIR